MRTPKKALYSSTRALPLLLCAVVAQGCFGKSKGGGGGSASPAPSTSAGTSQSTAEPGAPAASPELPVPPAPKILSPASETLVSNQSSLGVSGTCSSGNTVIAHVLETELARAACEDSAFALELNAPSDGVRLIQLEERSPAGARSAATSLSWTRDTIAPAGPTVSLPTTAATYTSSQNALTLSGSCEPQATVHLAGDPAGETGCADGSYSFTVTKSTDGAHAFSVSQTDPAGNASSATSFTWIRDSSIPVTPLVTLPAATPFYSSQSSLSVTGTCTSGHRVTLSGADEQNVICEEGAYGFTINKSTDGTYSFTLKQTNLSNSMDSATTSFSWIRDTLAPAAPVITQPASSPHTSAGSTLILSGTCEDGATVNLSGDASANAPCTDSAFSFVVSQPSDGIYHFSVAQMDRAGNASTAASLDWTRDNTIPLTPVLASPAANPVYSNGDVLTLSGSCTPSYQVRLEGGETRTASCTESSFSFLIAASVDGTYSFSVAQVNPLTQISSAQVSVSWIRDTQAPAAPVLISPSTSTYSSGGNLLLSGTCEDGATVHLGGSDTQAQACDSTFSFVVSKGVDGSYSFTLGQTDRAGNASETTSIQWTRDSSVPAAPTLLNPATSPLASNGASLELQGSCESGSTVTLGGDVTASEVLSPAGSLSAECSSGSFQYTVAKTEDGTYQFSLLQRDAAGNVSGSTLQSWKRDTVAPASTITAGPAGTSLSSSASFSFTVNETDSISRCSLDGAAYTACTSPVSYSNLANGPHTFSVLAVDAAGNVESSPKTHSWTQQYFKTIALYHFDTVPAATDDASLYLAPHHNDLTNAGTSAGASASFGQSQQFTAASSQYLSAPASSSLALANQTMTVEAWVKFNSLPVAGSAMVIASQSGAPGQYGWELALIRVNNKYYLTFLASLDGLSLNEVRSGAMNNFDTSSFHHVAMTWNMGAVRIYFDGTQKAASNVGTAGSSFIFNTAAPLRLGRNEGGSYLNGLMDEFRLSNVVRWPNGFTTPASAYTAD